MMASQDLDEYFLHAEQLRFALVAHMGPVSDHQLKPITANGLSNEYPDVLFAIRSDPRFSVDDIHRTISLIQRKYTSRNAKRKISTSRTTIASKTDSKACFSCNNADNVARKYTDGEKQTDTKGREK